MAKNWLSFRYSEFVDDCKIPEVDPLRKMWNHSLNGSPVRHFVVDLIIYRCPNDWYEDKKAQIELEQNASFTLAILIAYLKKDKTRYPRMPGIEKYLQETDDKHDGIVDVDQ